MNRNRARISSPQRSRRSATLSLGHSATDERRKPWQWRSTSSSTSSQTVEAVGKVDSLEVLVRRYTAVLHAETSTCEFTTCFESPEGPFVEVKIFNRVENGG